MTSVAAAAAAHAQASVVTAGGWRALHVPLTGATIGIWNERYYRDPQHSRRERRCMYLCIVL